MNYTKESGSEDDHDIILYSLSTCPRCNETKKFLKEKGHSYRYINVDETSRKEKREITMFLRRHNLTIAFPVLVIDEKIIQGFKPTEIKKLLELSQIT